MNDDINISNDRDLLDDDTTGHAMRGRGVQPAENDTDGHGRRHPAPEVTEDDTDGHASRGRGVQPADDDTDGHAYKSGR